MKDKELKKHNKLKWTLKDELEMLTIDELLKIQKLIVSFYNKEVKDETIHNRSQSRNTTATVDHCSRVKDYEQCLDQTWSQNIN